MNVENKSVNVEIPVSIELQAMQDRIGLIQLNITSAEARIYQAQHERELLLNQKRALEDTVRDIAGKYQAKGKAKE